MFQNNLSWAHTSGHRGVCMCVCSGWVLGCKPDDEYRNWGPEGALPFSQGLGMNLGVVLLEDPVFGS